MREDLNRLRQELLAESSLALPIARMARKPGFVIAGLVVLCAVAAVGALLYRWQIRVRWAREQALPQVQQLFAFRHRHLYERRSVGHRALICLQYGYHRFTD